MSKVRLILDDAIAGIQRLEDSSVDLVLTDPPYESLEKWRATGTTTRLRHSKMSSNDWFEIFPNERFNGLFAECFRVMKTGSHLYMFCDDETSDIAKAEMVSAGFCVWKRLVWDKRVISTGYHYRNQHEFILFAEKGHRNLNDRSIPSILRCKRIAKGYPAEKPVELQNILVSQSASEGDVLLDPFCGSASSGEAALNFGLDYIGVDISEKALKIAVKRLKGKGARVI